MTIEALPFGDTRWNHFVMQFPNANIFHSSELNASYSRAEGFEVFPLFALHHGQVVAAAFPVLVKLKSVFRTKYTNRVIMYSSPLYLENEKGIQGIQQILKTAERLARKRALFLELRNSEMFPRPTDMSLVHKYTYIPYQNFVLDLTKGSAELFRLLRTDARNRIRKADKLGLVVRESAGDEIRTVVDLLENLYKRKGIPFGGRQLFYNIYEDLSIVKKIRVIVAEHRGNIIATRLSLNHKFTVYDWYAAADPRYTYLCPNEALVWDAVKWGCDNGFRIYDFGGAAIKGKHYGPADFKEKFSGARVEYGRYRFITNTPVYKLGEFIYNLRTKTS